MYSSPAPSRLGSPLPDYSQHRTAMSVQQQPQAASRQPQSRQMQVKILYSFDDDGKNNCLARCPQPVNIQTAFLDANTEVGIIELRTCIQAIITASPELLAKLGKDYTVYAYDFSEYETPMVGQGMLSWVLASASSTPMAPAEESKTMVTGRVNKAPGLFSNMSKETLEVKLRLVPVPTSLQSEYLASMEKFRDTENVIDHGGFDAVAWTEFLNQNPGFGDNAPSPAAADSPILGEGGQPEISAWPTGSMQSPSVEAHQDAASFGSFHSAQSTRHDSPAFSLNAPAISYGNPGVFQTYSRPTTPSQPPPQRLNPPSRPDSRASVGQVIEQVPSRRQSFAYTQNAEAHSQDSFQPELEEGPSRKRIRTEKADWRGPSNFASSNEPLRITASAAASMRGTRLSNTAAELSAVDPANRPPTPRPHSAPGVRKPSRLSRSTSSLNPDPLVLKQSSPAEAHVGVDQFPQIMSSPERQESIASTPQDIPSSPPIFIRPSPTPSSPILPQHPPTRFQDSGFASSGFDEYDEEDEAGLASNMKFQPVSQEEKKDRPSKKPRSGRRSSNVPPVKRTMSELSILEEVPGDPSLLPTKILPRPKPPPPRRKMNPTIEPSHKPLSTKTEHTPNSQTLVPPLTSDIGPLPQDFSSLSDVGDLDRDTSLATDTVQQCDDDANRGRSFSQVAEDALTAESLAVDEATDSNTTRKPAYGKGSSMKRKRAIERQLATALAEGRMPQFCKNCGAIQTPTWRKAFVKVCKGSQEEVEKLVSEGGHVTWEAVTRDEHETVTSYRIIKKSVNPDEGFEEIQLCNPCGIWFFKFKTMRPPDKWDKEPPKPRKRPPKSRNGAKDCTNSTQSEPAQQPPASDYYEPEERPDDSEESQNDLEHMPTDRSNELQLNPPQRMRRANSINYSNDLPVGAWQPQPIGKKSGAATALQRAIQSSPPRFPGSKFSPIEIDLDVTPRQPVRRNLFSSPRRKGEMKSLEAPNLDGSPSSIPTLSVKGIRTETGQEGCTSDKENDPKAASFSDDDNDDEFHLLFNSQPRKKTKFTVPITPKSASKTSNISITPTSSAKRGKLMPKDISSSASRRNRINRPFETPTRRALTLSVEHSEVQMSPFTAQLTKLISEANYHTSPGRLSLNLEDTGLFAFSDFSTDDMGAMLDMNAIGDISSEANNAFPPFTTVASDGPARHQDCKDVMWDEMPTEDIDVFMKENSTREAHEMLDVSQ